LVTYFAGDTADILGFITICGTLEIGMTHVQVSFGAADGIGNLPIKFGWQRNPSQPDRPQMQQNPLGRQMNGQRRYDPIRFPALFQMPFQKFHAIGNSDRGSRARKLPKVFLPRVDQDKMPVFEGFRQPPIRNRSKLAQPYNPYLFHDDESNTKF